MKTTTMVLATLLLPFGLSVQATPIAHRGLAPAVSRGMYSSASGTTSSVAGSLLREAYAELYVADHDYHGHRIAAMRQIEKAAKKMHITLRGDGRGHEKQGTSDEHLRKAQALLQKAVNKTSGGPVQAQAHLRKDSNKTASRHVHAQVHLQKASNKTANGHVQNALEELSTALRIK